MKKIIIIVLSLVFLSGALIVFSGCTVDNTKEPTYEVALVTHGGTIDDKSFNQSAWEGIVEYADANDSTYKYYPAQEESKDSYIEAIDLAVLGGAKVVITPGVLFEVAIFEAQTKYPNVTFLLLDGAPHNADYSEYRTDENVLSIMYAEEQAGYLAGYAAVQEGYRELGFMGGSAVPPVIRFGYGFLQGANAAAEELELSNTTPAVTVKYYYTGTFSPDPAIQTKAASWYTAGTEVIFACGGQICTNVFAAAEENDAKVIGVDIDQSTESDTVITSAMKGLSVSVMDSLTAFNADTLVGGQTITVDASKDGVGLPALGDSFATFTQTDYDTLYGEMAAGNITIIKDKTTAGDVDLVAIGIDCPYISIINENVTT